jgi:hypothetical protein
MTGPIAETLPNRSLGSQFDVARQRSGSADRDHHRTALHDARRQLPDRWRPTISTQAGRDAGDDDVKTIDSSPHDIDLSVLCARARLAFDAHDALERDSELASSVGAERIDIDQRHPCAGNERVANDCTGNRHRSGPCARDHATSDEFSFRKEWSQRADQRHRSLTRQNDRFDAFSELREHFAQRIWSERIWSERRID